MEGNQPKQKLRTRDAGVSGRFSALWFSSILICVLSSGLGLVGCVDDHKQNSDQLKEKTAETTAELKRDAKSVAEGVKEGWSRDKERVDLNSATREELLGAGLTRAQSDHVIEHRPYANSRELLTKHVLAEDEYKEIEPRVKAGGPSDK
jgi:DNA uptake protein ComE-like DNA-binding protein